MSRLRYGLLCLLLVLVALPARAEVAAVGQITLRLGEAWVVGAQGARREARADAPVHAGEVVETAASGHVHIRFVDGGVVSVRPNSRLLIAEYSDPAAGGAVRFKLERGTARSVTGRYGESERSRFRLNTPIVAIGINGTDFVVESRPDATRVAVFSGSIVAAPFDEACRPEGLGVCGGERAMRLSADMGAWLLEIRPQDGKPLLLPRGDFARARDNAATSAKSAAAVDATEVVTQAQILPQIAEALRPATLVWGRWAHAAPWPGEEIGSTAQVAEIYQRVAENARYALYRLPQAEPLPRSGSVSLGLAAAQAHLQRPDGVSPAQVKDGRLDLDFAARRFSTALSLESAATGTVPFSAAGAIQPDGTFSLIEVQSRLRGAWGTGGSGASAGYLFEHNTPQGVLTGTTLWR